MQQLCMCLRTVRMYTIVVRETSVMFVVLSSSSPSQRIYNPLSFRIRICNPLYIYIKFLSDYKS